jgi:hypothetical protein
MNTALIQFVMLALVASIHVLNTARDQEAKTWVVGTSPTMTVRGRYAWIPGSGLWPVPERRVWFRAKTAPS